MAGNTPIQLGPGDVAGVQIPGPIGFYTTAPVAVQTVTQVPALTTNPTAYITMVHTTVSQLQVALRATGLIL